jgi:murein DD-endopeptidase MepM/ murein hydrolase activator NlpD
LRSVTWCELPALEVDVADLPDDTTELPSHVVELEGFLANHTSAEQIVEICVEPAIVYSEVVDQDTHLNFDFIVTGLTKRTLDLVFLKVAAYDTSDSLVTYRYLNRNAVGPSGIETLGRTMIEGRTALDIFNPFHTFPTEINLARLRYMFTFRDRESGEEFYFGDVQVVPQSYIQEVKLNIPVKGLVTVADGYDYFSHHRRFAMSIAREATRGAMQQNFARFAIDFVHIGEDGNTRRMPDEERRANYDFHFVDARRFYSDGAPVYAPGTGRVVVAEDGHPDLYEGLFDFDSAVERGNVHELAGNYVVIEHNDREYSHLFHFENGSIQVAEDQNIESGQILGRIGFSGAATVYSHLHYQLMDGPDFLVAAALPAKFDRVEFVVGDHRIRKNHAAINTGDILWSE